MTLLKTLGSEKDTRTIYYRFKSRSLLEKCYNQPSCGSKIIIILASVLLFYARLCFSLSTNGIMISVAALLHACLGTMCASNFQLQSNNGRGFSLVIVILLCNCGPWSTFQAF